MADSHPEPASCDEAFVALKKYDRGSSRALLLPLDQAVTSALKNEKARAALEAKLLASLQAGGSLVAREYICTKLTLLGSADAVPALIALVTDPQLSTPARTALQAIPGSAVGKALRRALSASRSLVKVGVIHSLGMRREAGAVGALADFLRDPDAQVAGAAAAALGEIGTVRAGRALLKHFAKATEANRRKSADAILTCAERLAEQGRKTDARALSNLLETGQPAYIRAAATKR